jgi:hypothetical protein
MYYFPRKKEVRLNRSTNHSTTFFPLGEKSSRKFGEFGKFLQFLQFFARGCGFRQLNFTFCGSNE